MVPEDRIDGPRSLIRTNQSRTRAAFRRPSGLDGGANSHSRTQDAASSQPERQLIPTERRGHGARLRQPEAVPVPKSCANPIRMGSALREPPRTIGGPHRNLASEPQRCHYVVRFDNRSCVQRGVVRTEGKRDGREGAQGRDDASLGGDGWKSAGTSVSLLTSGHLHARTCPLYSTRLLKAVPREAFGRTVQS